VFTAPNSQFSYGEKREEKEALKQVASWREAHKNCKIMQAANRA